MLTSQLVAGGIGHVLIGSADDLTALLAAIASIEM
jgi:hypothetical protein